MWPRLSSLPMDENQALPTFRCQLKSTREQGRLPLLWGELFLGKGSSCTQVLIPAGAPGLVWGGADSSPLTFTVVDSRS